MLEPMTGGIIGVCLLLILLFLGLPIFVCLGFAGTMGLILIEGFSGMTLAISNVVWTQVTSVGLLAVPVFILMGNIVGAHEFGRDLYDTASKWLGRVPGSLAIVSTIVSALFGFMCGSGIAGTATIGGVAQPEMERKGYNRRLALGTHAMGGGLSAIIPPSILMILYAVQAECSMGRMFFAGIVPGLLLTILMAAYISGRAIINPALCPKPEPVSTMEKVKSLVNLIPLVILFLVVLGGIYAGIWAPTEAGAAGAFFVLLIVIFYGRLTRQSLKKAIASAGRTTVMIYMLVVGANIFSLLCFASGISDWLQEFILSFKLPNWGIIIILLLMITILGCFLDVMALLLIVLPISLPIVKSLGYDPVWWGIIMIVGCELAMITPPIGIHLFVILGIAEEGTTLWDVAMGAAPFVVVIWILFALLILFPELALWLPGHMR
ncbi:MAG: TRAP transporter large permease subunit [Deltaproteobacteria bacterium]|nr:TRAP transporter large permease subunit [Deltaproteobacteria bacterium]MBW2120229.1 TRAP transporter large permease subunit [Deltaproteobacteria bacterium]